MTRSCGRPGCAGGHEDTGEGELYCDTCGLAPVVAHGGVLGPTPTGLTHPASAAGRADGSARAGGSGRGGVRGLLRPGRTRPAAPEATRDGGAAPALTLARQSRAASPYGAHGSTPAHVRPAGRADERLPASGGASVQLVPLHARATALALPVPRVAPTDRSCVSTAFGLARVRPAAGDGSGAVDALESVPEVSIHCTAARVAAVRARPRQRSPQEPLLEDLYAAAHGIGQLQDVGLDALRREELTCEVLGSALGWVLAGSRGAPVAASPGAPQPELLGSSLDEDGLRFGQERSYRLLARLAQSGTERIELVERANRFHPRTWV